jgi:hypothetical protein
MSIVDEIQVSQKIRVSAVGRLPDAPLRKHLPDLVLRGVAAGLHLAIELPAGANETVLVDRAEKHGILVHGLRAYCARSGAETPAILLGYCQLSERNLVQGATALAALLKSVRPNVRATAPCSLRASMCRECAELRLGVP